MNERRGEEIDGELVSRGSGFGARVLENEPKKNGKRKMGVI